MAVVGLLGLVGLIGMTGACGTSTTTPTPVLTPVASTAQFFSTLVTPGATTVSTFAVSATSTVGVTLASVVVTGTGQPILPLMHLSLGTPGAGNSCTPTTTQSMPPALTAQIQTSLAAGTYCVAVTDFGGIGSPATVTVRVAVSDGTPQVGTVTLTDVLTSVVTQHGVDTHEVVAGFGGPATINLATAGDGTVALGVSFGVWDGSTCRVNTTTTTVAGVDPQLTPTIDAGAYCLQIFDPGTLTAPTSFTITTSHQ
jgi:hypothetical protein